MFYIAICDDEELTLKSTKENLEKIIGETNVKAQVSTFPDGEGLLKNYEAQYNLIILDVEMKNMNGIETAKCIREKDTNVIIIFITNFLQYAVDGYRVNAYRYLLKPLKYDDFKSEILSSFNEIDEKNLGLIITSQNTNQLIKKGDIFYIESFGHSIIYHLEDTDIECKGTMNEVEIKLNSLQFYKIHKSYIVNLQYIKSFDDKSVQMTNGKDIPISRYRYGDFKKHNMQFWSKKIG